MTNLLHAAESRLVRALRYLFVDGPRHLEPADRSFWDTLFTWPVRLFIVASAWAVGRQWGETPIGIHVGWGLQYGLFIAVAIVIAFWLVVFLANAVLAGAWVYMSRELFEPALKDGSGHGNARHSGWRNRGEVGQSRLRFFGSFDLAVAAVCAAGPPRFCTASSTLAKGAGQYVRGSAEILAYRQGRPCGRCR